MIVRFVVPAMAAAALGLSTASAFAQQTAQTAAQQCAALEAQIDTNMPMTMPNMIKTATAEREEGAKLCNSGKTEEGIAKLQQALADALDTGAR
jgi:hypothetical protein